MGAVVIWVCVFCGKSARYPLSNERPPVEVEIAKRSVVDWQQSHLEAHVEEMVASEGP